MDKICFKPMRMVSLVLFAPQKTHKKTKKLLIFVTNQKNLPNFPLEIKTKKLKNNKFLNIMAHFPETN